MKTIIYLIFKTLNWRIIALQYGVDFYQTSAWISHRFTHVPPPTWTSLLPPSPSHPSGLLPSSTLISKQLSTFPFGTKTSNRPHQGCDSDSKRRGLRCPSVQSEPIWSQGPCSAPAWRCRWAAGIQGTPRGAWFCVGALKWSQLQGRKCSWQQWEARVVFVEEKETQVLTWSHWMFTTLQTFYLTPT